MNSNLINIEAECDVLGAMICSRGARDDILNILTENDFSEINGANQLIFKAISRLAGEGSVIDIPSLTNELGINMKVLDKIGGVDYLVELSERYISDRASVYHANNVKDLSLARRLCACMDKCVTGFNKKEFTDIGQYVAECEKQILEITKARRVSDFMSAGEIVQKLEDDIKAQMGKEKKNQRGVTTGFRLMDYLTKGWQAGQFNIVGARPSVGKTAFALNLAFNAANKTEKTVGFFSLEMDSKSIVKRLLSLASEVSTDALDDTSRMTKDDWLALENGVNKLKKCKIFIDDTPNEKLNDIKTKAHKLKAECPDLCVIFIDYLGLITTNNTKIDSRQLEVSEISRQLKGLARELEVPIICLSQLSRDNEKRASGERMPKLSDLRDSGSIEQDADIVMFVHRENYQNEKAQKEKENQDITDINPYANPEDTVINIAKNRNGKIGPVRFAMFMNIGKFEEIDSRGDQQQQ